MKHSMPHVMRRLLQRWVQHLKRCETCDAPAHAVLAVLAAAGWPLPWPKFSVPWLDFVSHLESPVVVFLDLNPRALAGSAEFHIHVVARSPATCRRCLRQQQRLLPRGQLLINRLVVASCILAAFAPQEDNGGDHGASEQRRVPARRVRQCAWHAQTTLRRE
eukprot:362159-Chlamydomonas_euryale.AAC.16